jgi:hypothetical protein
MALTWDILICSIVHRTDELTELLTEFKRQLVPGVGIRVYRDNLETVYGSKCQKLLDSSDAEYVSFFDDDDWPAEDFVKTIVKALKKKPDYVGFNVKWTEDGRPQAPVKHSLQYHGWHNGEVLTRDIVHFNPIRRELAVQGRWEGGCGADQRWSDQVRGLPQTEEYIDRDMLHYRHTGGAFTVPPPLQDIPPQPEADWVTWLT